MKYAYATRTGNVEAVLDKLNISDAIKIESGSETVDGEYVLFTYTDGYGDIPMEVEEFLGNNADIKGVIASGDTGYGEAFCGSGDKIAEQYNVPCLYKVENDGEDSDIEKMKEILSAF